MHLRPMLLGLCLAACTSSGEGDELGSSSDTSAGSSAASDPGTSEPTTGADPTGLPEVTTSDTGDATDASVTGDPSLTTGTSGLETSGASDTTAGPDEPDEPVEPPADCPRVRVMVPPGQVLNVRPDPSTAGEPVGVLANGALADVIGFVQGEPVDGNSEWVQIETKTVSGYVWSGLVQCTLDEPSTDGFFLPLECGFSATVSQGNASPFSHQGASVYAFDFALGIGTPLVAIADGTVSHLFGGTNPGDPCYNGGGVECIYSANYVTVLHGDGTSSSYAHLSSVSVVLGQFVPRGATVGLSGSTGYSTGPHAHVARQESCAAGLCQSIPVSFTDVPGDGVPVTGQMVTSQNCP